MGQRLSLAKTEKSMNKKLNPNEAPAGYVAVADASARGCSRCAINGMPACDEASCTANRRDDGCGVVFVKREPASLDARLTIRLPAAVKAKAQRIGAAKVIAAIEAVQE